MIQPSESSEIDVVVVGAACLDVKARLRGDTIAGTSNAGDVRLSVGGVARNIAENLARIGMTTALLSAVCEDDFGQTIVRQTAAAGVDMRYVLRTCSQHSAAYIAMLGVHGDLLMGVDDTSVIAALDPSYIAQHAALLAQARMVVVDANLPVESAEALLAICRDAGVPVTLDPVAFTPAMRYRHLLPSFFMVVPNEIEATALTDVRIMHESQASRAAQHLVSSGCEIAIVKCASAGVVYATSSLTGNVPALAVEVVDPTGAGDALTAAIVYALLNDIPIDEAVRLGVSAAALTLSSPETVRQDLSLESLYAQLVV